MHLKKIQIETRMLAVTAVEYGSPKEWNCFIQLKKLLPQSSYCCDKTHEQKQLGEKWFISSHTSRQQSISERSQGRNLIWTGLGAGTEAGAVKSAASWLFQDRPPRVAPPLWAGPPTTTINPDNAPQAKLVGAGLLVEGPSSQVTLTCLKLTLKTNQHCYKRRNVIICKCPHLNRKITEKQNQ